jgi:hypothetical protein
MRVIWVIAVLTGILRAAGPPTFYRDVQPVLERNCQSCHRAVEAAPMPLVTYKDARPWAKAMRQAVLTKKVPTSRCDFSWHLQYYLAEPLELACGSRIECLATFDNSPNNPANPDPSKEVRDQSWEEMLVGTVDVAIDAHRDPMDLYRPARKRLE